MPFFGLSVLRSGVQRQRAVSTQSALCLCIMSSQFTPETLSAEPIHQGDYAPQEATSAFLPAPLHYIHPL